VSSRKCRWKKHEQQRRLKTDEVRLINGLYSVETVEKEKSPKENLAVAVGKFSCNELPPKNFSRF